MHSELRWVGLPVGENFGAKFRDVLAPNTSFLPALIATISCSYAKGHNFGTEIDAITHILRTAILPGKSVVEINTDILFKILNHLNVPQPPAYFSSSFPPSRNATERIIECCAQVGASEVIIGTGSSIAVHDWQRVRSAGIRVSLQDYTACHPIYQQTRRRYLPFQPGLSIVDALLNVGRDQTREFVTSSIFTPKPLDDPFR